MNVLVLGADGMLGAALMSKFDTFLGTSRRRLIGTQRVLQDVDVTRLEDLRRAFDWAKPEAVINCVGVVKSECVNYPTSWVEDVNGNSPHVIAGLAAANGVRVIHVSTDCVFDGTHGNRTEEEITDARDLYGKSKAAGELLSYGHCVTLRTSFIGRDRTNRRGLLEWLLAQTGETIGYSNAFWSGLSACELARVIGCILSNKRLTGLYNVAGPLISKADLLQLLIEVYALPCRVRRVSDPSIDRSLDGSKFKRATGYVAPTWIDMAKELAAT